MTRELVEKAKAVVDLLIASGKDEGFCFESFPNTEWKNAIRALRAAVRAAEAAPVADAERVLEAASEALAALFNSNDATPDGQQRLVADAIRPYITPATGADTVAVPVATLREIRRDAVSTHTFEGYPESSCSIAKIIDAILPPPPASGPRRARRLLRC